MVRVLVTQERLVPTGDPAQGEGPWQDQASTRRFLHKFNDPGLFGSRQRL